MNQGLYTQNIIKQKDDEIEKLSVKLKKAIEQRDNYSKQLAMTDLEHEYFKNQDNKEINEI